MKVIFLDIDGVMNSYEESLRRLAEAKKINPAIKTFNELDTDIPTDYRMKLLKKICDETGAKVAMSSSWRSGFKVAGSRLIARTDKRIQSALEKCQILDKLFHDYGIEVIGKTSQGVKRANFSSYVHSDEKLYGDEYKSWENLYDRGAEVLEWLNKHPDVTDYVIIDDEVEDWIDAYTNKYVKTNWVFGLREQEAEFAIGILNRTMDAESATPYYNARQLEAIKAWEDAKVELENIALHDEE